MKSKLFLEISTCSGNLYFFIEISTVSWTLDFFLTSWLFSWYVNFSLKSQLLSWNLHCYLKSLLLLENHHFFIVVKLHFCWSVDSESIRLAPCRSTDSGFIILGPGRARAQNSSESQNFRVMTKWLVEPSCSRSNTAGRGNLNAIWLSETWVKRWQKLRFLWIHEKT